MANIPKDVSIALKDSGLAEFFSAYPPSHRREYLKWISEAKKPETRERRIQKTMKMLSAKRAAKSAHSKKNA